VVVMYFSPDCDHCQEETRRLTDSMYLFENWQFVFVSYAPFGELKKYYADYGLHRFSNIIYGRDTQFFFPRFYNVKFTPFVAVYGADWKLIRVFEGGTTAAKLAAVIR
jgi:Thioredoxin-like